MSGLDVVEIAGLAFAFGVLCGVLLLRESLRAARRSHD